MIDKKVQYFKNSKYHYQIDTLRGFAALLVVIYHFILGTPERFNELSHIQRSASLGHLGVQVFFVISGFVIANSMHIGNYQYRSFSNFFLKRLSRLEPPYLLSVLICIALAYFGAMLPGYRGEPVNFQISQILAHLGYLNAFLDYDWVNPVYWTLAIEFQFYLFMAIVFPLLRKKEGFFLIILLTFVVFLTLPRKEFLFQHLPFFFLGITLYRIKNIEEPVWVVVLAIIFNALWIGIYNPVSYLLFGVLTFFIILLAPNLHAKWSIFLGSISYSLYLLHVPIGQRIINFLERKVSDQYLLLGVVVAVIIFMIGVSAVYYFIIEKPSQKLSKRIKY